MILYHSFATNKATLPTLMFTGEILDLLDKWHTDNDLVYK